MFQNTHTPAVVVGVSYQSSNFRVKKIFSTPSIFVLRVLGKVSVFVILCKHHAQKKREKFYFFSSSLTLRKILMSHRHSAKVFFDIFSLVISTTTTKRGGKLGSGKSAS